MASGTVISQTKFFDDGYEVLPKLVDITYEDSFLVPYETHVVAAGATNATVPITGKGTIVRAYIWAVDSADDGKITLKVNSDTITQSLNPLVIYSENITGLTATNSDTDSTVEIAWRLILS